MDMKILSHVAFFSVYSVIQGTRYVLVIYFPTLAWAVFNLLRSTQKAGRALTPTHWRVKLSRAGLDLQLIGFIKV